LPAAHAVHHVSPLGPVYPALQLHMYDALQPLQDAPELEAHATQVAASVAAVIVEYVPAAQSVHAAVPVLILYLPAAQGAQFPSGPV
jgi:hypothetical protein